MQLTVKRPPTEAEKAQVVREVLAARLGVPLDMMPSIGDSDIRDIAMIDDTGRGDG